MTDLLIYWTIYLITNLFTDLQTYLLIYWLRDSVAY